MAAMLHAALAAAAAPAQIARRRQQQQHPARRRTVAGGGGATTTTRTRRAPRPVAAAPAPPPPGGATARAATTPPSASDLEKWMRNFSMDFELRPAPPPPPPTPAAAPAAAPFPPAGPAAALRVAPLPRALLPAAADLLAGTFILSTTMSAPPPRPSLQPYARFVRRRIAKYLDDHLRPGARTLVLAATVPCLSDAVAAGAGGEGEEETGREGGAEAAAAAAAARKQREAAELDRQRMEDEAWDAIFSVRIGGGRGGGGGGGAATAADKNKPSGRPRPPPSPLPPVALVGTAELSLDGSTRSRYLTLNPPAEAAYLMNTAVAEAWRRRGVARALVAAADAVAAAGGRDAVWLHARLVDAPAVALYLSLGFDVVATDGWWVGLVGQDRRHLMRRAVVASDGGGGGVSV